MLRKLLITFICLIHLSSVSAQISVADNIVVRGEKSIYYRDGQLIISGASSQQTIPLPLVPDFYTLSNDGNWIIYSINSKEKKESYVINLRNDAQLIKTLPFAIVAADFSHDDSKAFLIHSKTFWKADLSVYDTRQWTLIRKRRVSDITKSIAVHPNDSQLIIASGAVVKLMNTATLKPQLVTWETSKLQQLVFSPTNPKRYASVNHRNVIEVRDMEEDRVILTIRPNKAPIINLRYTSDGNKLISLDAIGNLAVWNLNDRKKIVTRPSTAAFMEADGQGLMVLNDKGWAPYQDTVISPGTDVAFLEGPSRRSGLSLMPVIAYTPETSLLLGLGTNFVFQHKKLSATRPSMLTPAVSYAFNGQIQASLAADIYTANGWHFFNSVGYLRSNRSYFFGVGNNPQKDDRTIYRNNILNWNGKVMKQFGLHLSAGISYHLRNDSHFRYDTLQPLTLPDREGGLLVGAGPVVAYDSRNDLLFPRKGYFAELSFSRYDHRIGSDFDYNDLKFDGRGYYPLPILANGTTLAVQVLFHSVFNGYAPFYQLPYLSADRVLRGVWRNQYIDRQAAAVQAELRSFFSNADKRYGYVIFAGAGDVTPDFFNGYQPDIIGVGGLGWRWQIAPKIPLQGRLDVSVTTRGNVGISGGLGVQF